jgi:plasmid stabilization system protein ParE
MITELAAQDLDNIVSYIAEQLANPSAASRLLEDIAKCYGYLKASPQIYEICRDPKLSKDGYRKTVIHNYVLIYRIDEAARIVYILRFFYGGMDYAKLL